MIAPAIWATLAPFNPDVGLLVGLLLTVATVVLRFLVAKRIKVTETALLVGSATLASQIIGPVEVIAKEDQFFARGALADPRAFFALKSGLPGLVRVRLLDKSDPTPYVLVSTRHPERLAQAVTQLSNHR